MMRRHSFLVGAVIMRENMEKLSSSFKTSTSMFYFIFVVFRFRYDSQFLGQSRRLLVLSRRFILTLPPTHPLYLLTAPLLLETLPLRPIFWKRRWTSASPAIPTRYVSVIHHFMFLLLAFCHPQLLVWSFHSFLFFHHPHAPHTLDCVPISSPSIYLYRSPHATVVDHVHSGIQLDAAPQHRQQSHQP